MIATYEIPRLNPATTEQEYSSSLGKILALHGLNYSDFMPSQKDKELYDINTKVDNLYRNENLTKLTSDFIEQILKITDTIFLPNGEIQQNFNFISLSATENDGHGHIVIAKKEIDSSGEPYISFKIVDNEMKTLNTVDENPKILLLAKNAYFELNFEYRKVAPEKQKEKWLPKILNRTRNKTELPELPEYKLTNFYATKEISDKLSLYLSDLAIYDPIQALTHGKFYDKIKCIDNKTNSVMIIQREYRLLLKELRARSKKP